MVSSPSVSSSDEAPQANGARNFLLLVLLGALFCGFWLVDHTPFASEYFNPHGDVVESENRTADRIQRVNLITAPARLFMAMIGVAFLFFKPVEDIRNGGPIVITALLFIGFVLASVVWSVNPKVTIMKCLVLCCFCVAAYGLARQLKMEELLTIFAIICIAYIGVGFVAEVLLGNFTPHEKDYRFVGTCHPNSLGVYAGFCCLLAVVYFGYKPKMNSLLVAIFVLGAATLLLTKSRTAAAGLVTGFAAVWFTKVNPNQRVFVISTSLLFLVVIGIILTLSPNHTRARLVDTLAMGRTESIKSLTGRVPLWEQLVDSIEERPLVGHGYLAFWDKKQIENLKDALRWEVPHGHNMYIDWALDVGLVGLFLFLLMFATATCVAFYRAAIHLDRHAVFIFGLLLFVFVHGFAESLFKLPTFLAFMAATLTLKMALSVPATTSETDNADQTNALPARTSPILEGAAR